ncbi:unnamed protein product [Lymnaea stagnalis]|uniref:Serine protease n=1 Tax=Lymnaea stagnalis TaxID=6523 RepID=A0AAV2H920_LYMST
MPRSGTGRICRVSKHENVPKEPCPCKLCKDTSSPEVSWGEIFVVTATHVIYDQDETADASCLLNYDSQDEKGSRLDDANFIESEITDDKCWLRFFTHDLQLTDEIVAKVCRYDQLCEVLHAKYKKEDTTLQGENRFAVIVSHPHGSYKMVSVGQWTQRELMDKYHTQYVYNAMTCPGTSGATVYTLSMPGWFYVHTHSGAKPDGGFSGYGFEH